jgi:hypothetical protein
LAREDSSSSSSDDENVYVFRGRIPEIDFKLEDFEFPEEENQI